MKTIYAENIDKLAYSQCNDGRHTESMSREKQQQQQQATASQNIIRK